MNIFILSLLSFAIFAAPNANAKEASKEKAMSQSSSKQSHKQAAMQAPEGFVFIEEDFYNDVQDLPGELMSDAVSQVRNSNYGEAAGDLQAAARITKTIGQGSSKSNLSSASDRLNNIAKEVREQKIKDVSQLESQLAQVMVQKAEHHRIKASEEWAAKHTKAAGHDLEIAANDIEKAAKWSGSKIESGGKEAIRGARDVAGKLVAGTGYVTAEVGKAIDDLGSAVDRFGHRVEANRQPASSETGTQSGSTSGTTSGTTSGSSGESQ